MSLPPHLRHVRDTHQARGEAWEAADAAFTEAVLEARRAGYSLAEIAAACGLSSPGVRRVVVRGLERRLRVVTGPETS